MNHLDVTKQPMQPIVRSERPAPGAEGLPFYSRLDAEVPRYVGEVLGTIREGMWLILVTTVLVSLGVLGYKMTEKPLYEANSVVSIETDHLVPSSTDLISPLSAVRSRADELSFLINSGELNRRVARRLKEVAEGLKTDTLFSVLRTSAEAPSTEEVASRIRGIVQFLPAEQNMIRMKAVSPSRYEAIRLVNIYAEEYQRIEQERSRVKLAHLRDVLRARLDRRREELTRLDQEWELLFNPEEDWSRITSGETLIKHYGQLRAKLESQEFQLETERRQLKHLQEEYERIGQNLVELVGSGVEEEIEALQRRIAEHKIRAEEFYIHDPTRRGREDEVPELSDLVSTIRQLESKKNALAEQLVADILATGVDARSGSVEPLSYAAQIRGRIVEKELIINQLELNEEALRNRVVEIGSKLELLPERTVRQKYIERERAVVEQWYKTLQQELQKTEITLESETGNVHVVRQARGATIVDRYMVQDVLWGALLGLCIGFAVVFVRKAADRRIHRPADVEDQGFHVVGVIPDMESEIRASFGGRAEVEHQGASLDAHLLSILEPASSVAENYRLARTHIDFLYEDLAPQVVLITSPDAGDGKSVTAVNLAATMAESGRRTLLIDLDLREPSCHRLLDADRGPGITDLLNRPGAFLLEEFETKMRDLHFIPAGTLAVESSEVVGSAALREALHSLRNMFDSIIIDSPPVLSVADPVVISTLCDATILVCRSAVTDEPTLLAAAQTFEGVGIQVAGVILNQFEARKAGPKGFSVYRFDLPHRQHRELVKT